MHQCMTGQMGRQHKLLTKMPTAFTANSGELLDPLNKFVCDHRHEHEPDVSGGGQRAKPRLWTWNLAVSVADGIYALVKLARTCRLVAFPEIAVGPDDVPTAAHDEWWKACDGCRHRRAKTDPEHNRDPDKCKYPLVEPIIWDCAACKAHEPSAGNHSYEPGECKWAGDRNPRAWGARRRGTHPRAPRTTARSSGPTSDAQAQLPDGRDLAADDEAHLPPEDAAAPALGSGDAVAGEPTRATRGPDSVPRERRTWTESGVGPERGADWTRFEIGASLAVLRRGSPAACRRELRKLHLRWWHATVTQMTNTLRLAGISQSTLDGIVDVVKTCRECRSWETPGTATQQTLTLPDHFNQYVEGDILFWMKFMIFHFVDRCTRWQAGSDVASKTEQCLMDALYTQWIGIHGPMENFVIDGESALNTDAAKARFKADGINLKTRAPGQHARFAERHGAFLRAVLHIMTEQMKREGIELSPRVMVMSAFFALNALTTVGTKTPYQALYGRQPAMLPPIEGESIHDGADGRKEQRIRHIAINSMVQASAIAQTTRATKSRSSSSTFSDYNAGDLIDYHRPPPSKDVTGWHGPVPVTKNEPEIGQVIARINGRDLPCRYQDVRHTLLVTLMFFLELPTTNDLRLEL